MVECEIKREIPSTLIPLDFSLYIAPSDFHDLVEIYKIIDSYKDLPETYCDRFDGKKTIAVISSDIMSESKNTYIELMHEPVPGIDVELLSDIALDELLIIKKHVDMCIEIKKKEIK